MPGVRLPRLATEEDDAEGTALTSVKLASVGMVTAGLAHQIGNPLAAVVANLDVAVAALRELPRDDLAEVRAALEDAAFAADQLTRLVRSLTTFVRGGRLERRVIQLSEVVDDAVRIAGPRVRARGTLVTRVDGAPAVIADDRLVHVLVNLLENAAQSLSVEGTNEVRVEAFTNESGDAVVSVTDTGVGIPPAALARVFDPFVTTEPPSGVGLGLWICHRIVEELGGDLTAESEVRRGSTFRVVLPSAGPTAAR